MIDRLSGQAQPAAVFNGCRVTRSTDLTGQNLTSELLVSWDTEDFDTNGWHEGVTHPSRLTVPSGVNYVICYVTVDLANFTNGNIGYALVKKNGTTYYGYQSAISGAGNTCRITTSSGPIPVVAGDYLEASLSVNTDTSVDLMHTFSCFSVHAIG